MNFRKHFFPEINDYNRYVRRKKFFLILLFILLIGISLLSISVGSAGLSFFEILNALFKKGDIQNQIIIHNVRLPRIAAGIATGTALAMTGCIMQNVLRNPLASASTLGVSQGAAFGAALAIVYFGAGLQINSGSASAITVTNPYMVTICAFMGGILTTIVILFLSRVATIPPSSMILAGVAISAMFTGATTLIQYFSDDIKIASIVYWTFGNLGRAGWSEITAIFIFNFFAFIYFFINRWNYNAMESGIFTAKSLGVNISSTIIISMIICTLISAVSIAFVGTINFIGLIAPHIVRIIVGNDYRFLIPASALMGSVIILLSDIVSRTIASPAILPIGALTSFLGAPLFLYMIIKKGNGIK